jgi:hypothetical protein
MATRNIISGGRVIDKQWRAIASGEIGAPSLIFLFQKASPICGEALGMRVKLAKRMSQELFLFGTKNRKGRWVGFDAGALVVQNQNSVQGILENGLEFTSGGVEGVGRFLIVPTQEDQESGVERNCEAKRG